MAHSKKKSNVGDVSSEPLGSAFPNAAQLSAGISVKIDFNRCPLEVDVLFGEQIIADKKQNSFRLRFRTTILQLFSEDCQVDPSYPRYRRTLSEEDFVQYLTRAREKKKKARFGSGAQTKIQIKRELLEILSGLSVDVDASISFEQLLEVLNRDEVRQRIRIPLVEPVAGDAWNIGSRTLGDPSKYDGLLMGNYFQDPRDEAKQDDDSETRLCCVQPVHDVRNYKVVAELRAKIDDCEHETIGLGWPEWLGINRRRFKKALDIRSLQRAQRDAGEEIDQDEIVLARALFKIGKRKK